MTRDSVFKLPTIKDGDASWAALILGLPQTAFLGQDGMDARCEVIKCTRALDVAACPGSGKTTVLVAKLAILAKKWAWKTRGICVLSHTNAARREIERRLSSSGIAEHLLSYPHFVGTIHNFLNEFLALPWLRSQGYPIRAIDNSICQKYVWRNLDPKWRSALEHRHVNEGDIVILDTAFSPGKRHGRKFPCSEETQTYIELKKVLRDAALEGLYRHDDSLVWANDLLDKHPEVVAVLQERFPIVLIDETQDNSEDQSAILARIFGCGGNGVIVQRFGDSNQAVFDSVQEEDATTNLFPCSEQYCELHDTQRFGQVIADLADPLAIRPYKSAFVGRGPCEFRDEVQGECPHTIFLFDGVDSTKVLDAYGQLLVETFPKYLLREGSFTAVGQVHNQPADEAAHKKPHYVGDYWPEYDPGLALSSKTPTTLLGYILQGLADSQTSGASFLAVESIGQGILQLASLGNQSVPGQGRAYCHRFVVRSLREHERALANYLDLVCDLAIRKTQIDPTSWAKVWREKARGVAAALAGVPLTGERVEQFLSANPLGKAGAKQTAKSMRNIYRYPSEMPQVEIEVGSIHSVKGQTHTATLILETFWNEHNLESLKEWILDPSRRWTASDGVRKKARLKLHYVAMTRPTHLLCIAMKRSTFEDAYGNLDAAHLQALKERGWRVVLL